MLKTPEVEVAELFCTVIEPSAFVHMADRLVASDGDPGTCTGPVAVQ